jgi:hypothetical protein
MKAALEVAFMTPAGNDSQEILGPPQFSMRTLLAVVTGCCVLFALMATVQPIWSLLLLLFLALVAAHVLGNALGTRLTERAPVREPLPAIPMAQPTKLVAGAQRLREHTTLGRGPMRKALIGGLLGAILGAVALTRGDWNPMDVAGVILGTVSSGVIGMFLGFLIASFVSVFRRALAEALTDRDG